MVAMEDAGLRLAATTSYFSSELPGTHNLMKGEVADQKAQLVIC
jgi:hypothetical protein